MNEDLTRDLPEHSFQQRVLSGLTSIDGRLTTLEDKVDRLDGRLTELEEKVDRRLQETRPIWESVQEYLRKLDSKFGILLKEFYEVRYDIVLLERRVERLEKTPST